MQSEERVSASHQQTERTSEPSTSSLDSHYTSSSDRAPLPSSRSKDSAPPSLDAQDAVGSSLPARYPTVSQASQRHHKAPSGRSSGGKVGQDTRLPQSSDLSSQLTNTLRVLPERILLLLIMTLARNVFGIATSQEAQLAGEAPFQSYDASNARNTASSDDSNDDGANSFAEKFKYAICSSFLLTPSLSISFYESSPPSRGSPYLPTWVPARTPAKGA